MDFPLAHEPRAGGGDPDDFSGFAAQRDHQRGHVTRAGQGIHPFVNRLTDSTVLLLEADGQGLGEDRCFEGAVDLVRKQHDPL